MSKTETNNKQNDIKDQEKSNSRNNNNKGKSQRNGRSKSNKSRKDFNTNKTRATYPGSTNQGCNDPSWYASNPALLRDSASIPFSWAVGTPIDLGIPNMSKPWSVPGIATLELAPVFGWSHTPNDPLNLAATSVYSFVRHANSGHSNYDAPDLMLYLMSMTQIYSYINWLQRIYGCASLYAQKNRYFPRALVEAQKVDFDSLFNHLADFRYGINLLINKCASLAIPATMPIFLRQAFLYQNVYCEGASVKDQMYMYVPHGFYRFAFDASHAGCLEYHPLPKMHETKLTTEELLQIGNDMLDALILDEDINIMSGDILKCYGSNIIKLTTLDESYGIVPLYNAAVLEQFKNATVFYTYNVTIPSVVQNATKAYLTSTPTWKAISTNVMGMNTARQKILGRVYSGNTILSTSVSEPDPAVVIENTRLQAIVSPIPMEGTEADPQYPILCGSEIAMNFCVHYYVYDQWNVSRFTHSTLAGAMGMSSTTLQGDVPMLARAGHFKFRPRVTYIVFDDQDQPGNCDIYFDVDNYAVINAQTLSKLHETALMSMLDVASIAKL